MSGPTALEVAVRVPERGLDVELTVASAEVVAVIGPNGAGKSTLLDVVAGLVRPASGHVRVTGTTVADDGGTWVPPHRRGTARMGQDPLLFPHLDVLGNVMFGPRSTGHGPTAARRRALEWLDRVDAAHLAGRRSTALSGGQAQRVALARALAVEPHVLLLDEPLSALDPESAPELRAVLRRVLQGRPAVLVTHDPLDVLALADTVAVLDAGRVVETGPARAVLSGPTSRFAARFADLDLVAGTATSGGLRCAAGPELAGMVDPSCPPGAAAVAVFAPSAVAVHVEPAHGSPRNLLAGRVTRQEGRGGVVRLHVTVPALAQELRADVTAAAVADLDLVPGRDVHLAVKATEVAVHAARTT